MFEVLTALLRDDKLRLVPYMEGIAVHPLYMAATNVLSCKWTAERESLMSKKGNIWITPHKDGWAVKREKRSWAVIITPKKLDGYGSDPCCSEDRTLSKAEGK